jgi:hypothetical protein
VRLKPGMSFEKSRERPRESGLRDAGIGIGLCMLSFGAGLSPKEVVDELKRDP